MSMGLVLEATEQYLREVLQLTADTIGIQFNTEPPPMSGQTYIGIDDAGVNQNANADSRYLHEVYTIDVGIWKRPGQFPKDRRRELMKSQNVYQPEVSTLDSLERSVIAALHKKVALPKFANERFGLPLGGLGDVFSNPFRYLGRGRTERLIVEAEKPEAWIGRRLRFTGIDRLQYVETQA